MNLRILLLLPLLSPFSRADWPQAAGPHGQFIVEGKAPDFFSASTGRAIQWRSPLPSTGQGAPIVVDGKIFVTSHETIAADTETGSTILGMCFDAETGKELWRRKLPASRNTDLSSLFCDNTAAAPVADEERVCFVNVGGSIITFDHEGTELWRYAWVPFGRHHARQHEPMLHDGKVIVLMVPQQDLDPKVTTKSGAKPLGRDKKYWTRLQAFDLKTGKRAWIADCGSSVHAMSMMGSVDGTAAILTGRGGGHQPPEEPYGLSLIDASNGKEIWETPVNAMWCMQVAHWTPKRIYAFTGKQLSIFDAANGKATGTIQLETGGVTFKKNPITYFSNLLTGRQIWFRTHSSNHIGRVTLDTGKVEYLEVPQQVVRENGKETLLDKAVPNDMKTANGFRATQDKRNAGSGWGHVSGASPIRVGKRIYMPTMVGTVYVLDAEAPKLDASALVSLSDLGPAGKTWTLSSLTYRDGRLYARTLKELICIGD